jgi:hypothetical protein
VTVQVCYDVIADGASKGRVSASSSSPSSSLSPQAQADQGAAPMDLPDRSVQYIYDPHRLVHNVAPHLEPVNDGLGAFAGQKSKRKKRHKAEAGGTFKAKDVQGNRGDRPIEELLNFIEDKVKDTKSKRQKNTPARSKLGKKGAVDEPASVPVTPLVNEHGEDNIAVSKRTSKNNNGGKAKHNEVSREVVELVNGDDTKVKVGGNEKSSRSARDSGKTGSSNSSSADSGVALASSAVDEEDGGDDFTTVAGSRKKSKKKRQQPQHESVTLASSSVSAPSASKPTRTTGIISHHPLSNSVPYHSKAKTTMDSQSHQGQGYSVAVPVQCRGDASSSDAAASRILETANFPALISSDRQWPSTACVSVGDESSDNEHNHSNNEDDDDEDDNINVIIRSATNSALPKFTKSFASVTANATQLSGVCMAGRAGEQFTSSSASSDVFLSHGSSSLSHTKDLSSCSMSETSSIAETSTTDGSLTTTDEDTTRPNACFLPLRHHATLSEFSPKVRGSATNQITGLMPKVKDTKSVVEFADGWNGESRPVEVTFGFDINDMLTAAAPGVKMQKQTRDAASSPIFMEVTADDAAGAGDSEAVSAICPVSMDAGLGDDEDMSTAEPRPTFNYTEVVHFMKRRKFCSLLLLRIMLSARMAAYYSQIQLAMFQ